MFQDNPWEAVAGLIRDTMKHQQNLAEERRQFDTNAQLTAKQIEIQHKQDMLNRNRENKWRQEDRQDNRINTMLDLFANEEKPEMKLGYLNTIKSLGPEGERFYQMNYPQISKEIHSSQQLMDNYRNYSKTGDYKDLFSGDLTETDYEKAGQRYISDLNMQVSTLQAKTAKLTYGREEVKDAVEAEGLLFTTSMDKLGEGLSFALSTGDLTKANQIGNQMRELTDNYPKTVQSIIDGTPRPVEDPAEELPQEQDAYAKNQEVVIKNRNTGTQRTLQWSKAKKMVDRGGYEVVEAKNIPIRGIQAFKPGSILVDKTTGKQVVVSHASKFPYINIVVGGVEYTNKNIKELYKRYEIPGENTGLKVIDSGKGSKGAFFK